MSKFCSKCGAALKEGAKFCPKCGTPVTEEVKLQAKTPSESEVSAVKTEVPVSEPKSMVPQSAEPSPESKPKKKNKKLAKRILAVVIALVLVIGATATAYFIADNSMKEIIDRANELRKAGEYEEAWELYNSTLNKKVCWFIGESVDRICNIVMFSGLDAYRGMVEIYLEQDQYEAAAEFIMSCMKDNRKDTWVLESLAHEMKYIWLVANEYHWKKGDSDTYFIDWLNDCMETIYTYNLPKSVVRLLEDDCNRYNKHKK